MWLARRGCCGGRVAVWRARPFLPSLSISAYRQYRQHVELIILIYIVLGYHGRAYLSYCHIIAFVRSSRPCTLRLRRSAWALRSKTWYVGVFFFGIHALVLPSPVFVAERSTTRGVDENLMTSLYSAFVSVFRERTEGTLGLGSISDSSVSERPDASNGGVGSRGLDFGAGSGGSSPSSHIRS